MVMLTSDSGTKQNMEMLRLDQGKHYANVEIGLRTKANQAGDQGKHYSSHVEIRLDQGKHKANVEVRLVVWGGRPRQTLQ